MKRIGIVICNYNKKDMVIKCIQCVLESKFTDYDIFVVDNASTDGSVDGILQQYPNAVIFSQHSVLDTGLAVIRNAENLGGSGGFNDS
ncbi:glycosyltransferase [bacterium D16-51]|nr:glycosyltransferase [bacterium D16-59]RKI57626.1 glycosyltransferase [bacterium D16-51]